MVPVYVKGGAWSNSEDEVLKAAISKYGLNQWARVSTLLPKKTAKQCRARWQEYLDPRIHKSDWTPEEDEKLLNLARLLPNQWRSIASSLGRTATQSVERYQKLLDDAAGVETGGDLGLTGLGAETLKAVGATSESHVGDLNVSAEHREAIPDAIDMDDDEKEMLSEARARLANTRGKKAARKARERMLDESKRIALLQKRRDLKQAGITTKLKAPKKKFATQNDYNADIPFEHRPTGGFYDTVEETTENDHKLKRFERQVDISGVKDDKKKEKRARSEKTQHTSIEKEAKLQDEVHIKKLKLDLPVPQFKDDELNELSKLSQEEAQKRIHEKAALGLSIDDRISSAANRIREDKKIQSALLITEDGEDDENIETPNVDMLEDLPMEKPSAKLSLRDRLAALPKPKNDFEIIADDEEDDIMASVETTPMIEESKTIPEDQGEKKRLEHLAQEKERKNALLRQSKAIQKGLPIPQLDDKMSFSGISDRLLTFINTELINLIRSDFSKLNNITGTQLLPDLDKQTTDRINAEIAAEVDISELIKFQNEFKRAHESSYVPKVDSSSLITELQSLVEQSNKLEKGLSVHIEGYVRRNETLTDEAIAALRELKDADRALAAFEMLRDGEAIAVHRRADALREEVDILVQAEERAQERYLELKRG